MSFGYKLLNHDGKSTKGGNKTWPLPDKNGPGRWMSTIYGEGIYDLCRRDRIILWIDRELYIAEFNEIIREDSVGLKVPDARLFSKVHSWDNDTQNDFMKKVFENKIAKNDLLSPDKKQGIDQLKEAYAAKDLMGVSRFATNLSVDPDEEIKRQNDLILEYIRDEIMNNFSWNEIA